MFKGSRLITPLTRSFATLQSKMFEEVQIKMPYGNLAGKLWNKDGKRTPAIACHGWMDNAGSFDKLCPLLNPDVPVFALDFPGNGHSSDQCANSGPYFSDLLYPIYKVIKHFKWEKVNLLGHSMGGGAAMLFASTFPHLVSRVVMIDLIKFLCCPVEVQPDRTAQAITGRDEIKDISSRTRYSYEDIIARMVKSYGGSLTEVTAKILLLRGATRHEDGLYSFNYSPFTKIRSPLSFSFEQQKAFVRRLKCDLLILKVPSDILYESQSDYEEILDLYDKTCDKFFFACINGAHHVHLSDPVPVAQIINDFFNIGEVSEDVLISPRTYFKTKLKNSL